jgi:hypothetical protein
MSCRKRALNVSPQGHSGTQRWGEITVAEAIKRGGSIQDRIPSLASYNLSKRQIALFVHAAALIGLMSSRTRYA